MFTEGQVLPSSQGHTLCFCFFMLGPFMLSILFFLQSFLRPLLTYAFYSITKLERFYRVASHAISAYLSFFPNPLLLSKASLPLIALTHFALSSYERAFRLLNSFSYFRFGGTLNETMTLQIFLASFCVHSPAHAFSYFS